ncbi:MAG: hypothetical protein LUD39_02670 [Opitutae bacterium]|nr:hypothetical protein [Opitutae bacterium]
MLIAPRASPQNFFATTNPILTTNPNPETWLCCGGKLPTCDTGTHT